jgi:hypothetical protein
MINEIKINPVRRHKRIAFLVFVELTTPCVQYVFSINNYPEDHSNSTTQNAIMPFANPSNISVEAIAVITGTFLSGV